MAYAKISTPPLLCWDLAQMGYLRQVESGKRVQDLLILKQFALKYGWTTDLSPLVEDPYETLVLTDNNQIIAWVNAGFNDMTGYPTRFAVGKTPGFLQGKGTCPEARLRIREKLCQHEIVTETIVNYRKNGEAYKCLVKIIPLFTGRQMVSHYLALEREVA